MFPSIIMDKKDPNRRKQKDKIDSLKVFDQRFWEDEEFDREMFNEAHRFLMQFDNRAQIRNSFQNLRRKIMGNENFFCEGKKSEPSKFWTMVFDAYKDDADLETWYEQTQGKTKVKTQVKDLISRALVIPYGSSSAERAFR